MPDLTTFEKLSAKQKIESLQGPILIFGAGGFIGINLFAAIYAVRKDCYAVTHTTPLPWRLRIADVPLENTIYCDITSRSAVGEVLEKYAPKTIVNLAAYGAYQKQDNAALIYETNFLGTLNILEQAKNLYAYVHAGSSSEYGYNAAAPKEEDKPEPNSHYALSKLSCSCLIQYLAKAKAVPAVNLRLYSIYGPWEEPDRLAPRLIEYAQRNSFPPLASPEVSRDFVYVDDCVQAFIHAACLMRPEIYGQSFNIAAEEKVTIRTIVETTANGFGVTASPEWASANNRNWDLTDWYGNAAKAHSRLLWKAKTPLAVGLKKTAEWQRNIGYETTILPAFQKPGGGKISCVIACYKDAQAIPVMYERIVSALKKIPIDYEIIFVNDNSPDNSGEVLKSLCDKDSNVVAITHSRNFGSQSAFLSGMEVATGDAIVLMDGDLQDPPELIAEFYHKWKQGFDVVYGIRVKREIGVLLGLFYKLFYRLFSKLSSVYIPKDAGDFSLLDRKVVDQLLALPETEQFLRGLRAWLGFKQTGIEYLRPERVFGKSTNNWRKNIGWAKKAIFSFSFVPVEVIGFAGTLFTGFSFLGLIIELLLKFINSASYNWNVTIVLLFIFFGGIQLLSASVLGEYISKIVEETKNRPKYIRTSIRKGRRVYDTEEKMREYMGRKFKD